eukprot:s1448_g16.t1
MALWNGFARWSRLPCASRLGVRSLGTAGRWQTSLYRAAATGAFGRFSVTNQLKTFPMTHVQTRGYNIQKVVNWFRIKRYALEVESKQRSTKNRNHAEVLKRFRLSRFGWQRRRSRLRDGKRRRRSWLDKKNSKKIDYVHRVDMLKMIRSATYFKLRIRDFPKDPNPNVRETRGIVGSHFG